MGCVAQKRGLELFRKAGGGQYFPFGIGAHGHNFHVEPHIFAH